jgi:RimJ/RimL family protein N-acetyltransferase
MVLNGEHIQLKTLTPAMVTQKYVDWMNDPDVTKYTESRFRKHTFRGIKLYVQDVSGNSDDYFYGIFLHNEHIGNIKLHINMHHNLGDIGLIIGDKQQWGKGYATEAIKLVTDHGFNVLGLHKIYAGIYSNNKGSIGAFMKAGFTEEAKLQGMYKCESESHYVDEIIVSRWKE